MGAAGLLIATSLVLHVALRTGATPIRRVPPDVLAIMGPLAWSTIVLSPATLVFLANRDRPSDAAADRASLTAGVGFFAGFAPSTVPQDFEPVLGFGGLADPVG